MSNDSTAVDFGINLLEEEIDDVIFRTNEFLTDATFTGGQGPFWWLLVVGKTIPCKTSFIRCISAICKFLSRDTNSARDKNGTKPRKNKGKNTLLGISLAEYLCIGCKGTNLSLKKRRKFPISLIINPHSGLCAAVVVIASSFDFKHLVFRKSGVKYCFALCWSFSKKRTKNRTNDVPHIMPNMVYMSAWRIANWEFGFSCECTDNMPNPRLCK